MYSLWQRQMKFPYYPILKCDQCVDYLYVGATLKNGVEAHFKMQEGFKVMMIDSETIAEKVGLGGMGIIKGETKKEIEDLHRLRDYINGRNIPCDMEVQGEDMIWVHPIKLFLQLTADVEIYEQATIFKEEEHRLDIGTAYIDFLHLVKDDERKNIYVHVFDGEKFPVLHEPYLYMRKYKNQWLIATKSKNIEGSAYAWRI